MTRPSLYFCGALAFCVLSLGGAWYGYHLVGEAGAEIIALAQQRRTLEAGIRQNQAKLADEARARQALQAKLAGAAAKTEAAPAADQARAPAREPTLDELLAADPKLFDQYLKGFRGNLHDAFAAIYQKYGITPEQMEKFETSQTAHEAELRDLRGSAEAQGLPMTDPGIAAMRQQLDQKYMADLIAQLGISMKTARQAQQEQRAVFAPMQDSVDSIATAATQAQAPLNEAQAAQLAQVMAGTTPEYQAGKPSTAKDIDWNAVLVQAPAFLSPAQVEGVRQQASAVAIQKAAREFAAQQQAAPR